MTEIEKLISQIAMAAIKFQDLKKNDDKKIDKRKYIIKNPLERFN